MADVITYRGARYVPIFADPAEWDNARAYDYMTLVMHEGNSYISKTNVPVGVDISNEQYWLLTANYNAQVEQYRQEVRAFDGRITTNADAIAAETSAREQADTTMQASIAAETSAREQADTNLQANITAETTAREELATQIQGDLEAVNDNIGNISTDINAIGQNLDELKIEIASYGVWENVPFTLSEKVSAIFSSAGEIKINKKLGLLYCALLVKVDTALVANDAIVTLTGYEGGTTTNYQISGLIEAKNTSTNEMLKQNGFISQSGEICTYSATPASYNVYILNTFPIDDIGGDFEPSEDVATEREKVCNLVKSWVGRFSYSQTYPNRLNPLTSGVTDCSGLIYCAYRDALNILLPNTGTPQMYAGATVATAQAGSTLDTSNLQPGDIIGFSTNGGDTYVHVIIYTGDGQCWEQNEWTKGANAGKKGPQQVDYTDHSDTTADLAHYRLNQYRKAVRFLQ